MRFTKLITRTPQSVGPKFFLYTTSRDLLSSIEPCNVMFVRASVCC